MMRDVDDEIVGHLGASQRLSPLALQRKLAATLGFAWDEFWSMDSQLMYGGINSDDVTEALNEPSGLADALHQRMAVEMGCRATSYDFALESEQRKLFPNIEYDMLPFDPVEETPLSENIAAIKTTIADLHWSLYGLTVDVNSEEVNEAYDLYYRVLMQYREINPGRFLSCRAMREYLQDGSQGDLLPEDQRLEFDSSYNVQAWTAVMVYLLSDFRFIYE